MPKVLILGGANQHVKLVDAAHRLGYSTIVVDYLKDSPAKRKSDQSYQIDIKDIDSLVRLCTEEKINGIVAGFLDPCQLPYAQLCEATRLPCLGTVEQFRTMTNKIKFKNLCKESRVDVINSFEESEINDSFNDYPVFVKPSDSRGSRGQTVCFDKKTLLQAIRTAKEESSDGRCVIEKFMGDCDEIQVTLFLIDGRIYLERTVDSYKGSRAYSLDNVVNCSVSPSKHTRSFIINSLPSVKRMINRLGIKNGPFFMQGFVKGDRFFYFDPGLRFPGVEYEKVFTKVFDISLEEWMVYYSVNGYFPIEARFPDEAYNLSGKKAAILFPVLRPGKLYKVQGEADFRKSDMVLAYTTRYTSGDTVPHTNDVNQRYAEIDILSNNMAGVAETIESFQRQVKVIDDLNATMLFDEFDVSRFEDYEN